MVSAPSSRADFATIGAAPVPVPPPRPTVIKTMSHPLTAFLISSSFSRAASSPIWGMDPAPRPRVLCLPMRILVSATVRERCWASVLIATRRAPWIPSSFIRVMVLEPLPPHPITAISVFNSLRIWSRSSGFFMFSGESSLTRVSASSTIDLIDTSPVPECGLLFRC